jgi:hypothetical protein
MLMLSLQLRSACSSCVVAMGVNFAQQCRIM